MRTNLCLVLLGCWLIGLLAGCGGGASETTTTIASTSTTNSSTSTTLPDTSTTTTTTTTSTTITTTTTSTTTTTAAPGFAATANMSGSNIVTAGVGLFGHSVGAAATRSIAGTVYDGVSLAPLSGITVWAGSQESAVTNDSGEYVIASAPEGAVTVTAVSTLEYDSDKGFNRCRYYSAAIITEASLIDFYLIRQIYSSGEVASGELTVNFLDKDGNPLSIDSDKFQSWNQGMFNVVDKYGVIHNPASLSGTISSATITGIPVGENLGLIVVAAGMGSGFGSVTIEAGSQSTNVTIYQLSDTAEVVTYQGIVSGIPAGHSLSTYNVATVRLPNYAGAIVSPTAEGTSSTYLISLPAFPGTDNVFNVSVIANGFKSHSSACLSTNSLTGGETISHDFELLEPPTLDNFVTAESGGQLIADLAWTKPASWNPDYYIVQVKGYPTVSKVDVIFQAYVVVPGDCTAVQIPIQPSTVVTIDGGVTVCESSGAVDLNAVNLREIFAPREAGVTP